MCACKRTENIISIAACLMQLFFFSQFLLIFSELWHINSQFRIIKSNCEGGSQLTILTFSHNCEFISLISDFITRNIAVRRGKVRVGRHKLAILKKKKRKKKSVKNVSSEQVYALVYNQLCIAMLFIMTTILRIFFFRSAFAIVTW